MFDKRFELKEKQHKCIKCGGNLIKGRLMTGAGLVGFIPLTDEKKFKQRYLKVICDTCVDCGCVENIQVENTESLK